MVPDDDEQNYCLQNGSHSVHASVCKWIKLIMVIYFMSLIYLWWRQNSRHFRDDNFKFQVHFIENFWISNQISLRYFPQGLIDNMPGLVQIMACCLFGAKPLCEALFYWLMYASLSLNELTCYGLKCFRILMLVIKYNISSHFQVQLSAQIWQQL